MQRSLVLVPLVASLLALSATAQTGRTMKLMAPVVLGQTASMVIQHSPSLAGHQFAMAMCSPTYAGAQPFSIPGVVEGVLRLDPLAYGVLGIGVLDASGQSPALTFLVPNDPLLVGASFDVQGADLDGTGLITLTENDLEIEVSAPPLASLNMMPIPAGTFVMGGGSFANELPYHWVTISRPFWMSKYEVTQAQYLALMGSSLGWYPGPNRPAHPASPGAAIAYCNALTAQEAAAGRLPTGYVYRLPTEAEWEYCCRAGTTTEWSTGNSIACGQASFYNELTGVYCAGLVDNVGLYAPNAWGLHDMHGNVWEWCLDRWDRLPNYPVGPVSDPYVATGTHQVFRGGCGGNGAINCRSAFRGVVWPAGFTEFWGIRVVCAPILP